MSQDRGMMANKSLTRRQFLKRAAMVSAGTLASAGFSSLAQVAPASAYHTQTDSPTTVAPAPDVVEITYWDMVWGPPEYVDAAKALTEKFNAEQSAIKVTYQSIGWDNYYQTFLTAVGSGTAPDISTGAGYQAFQLYDLARAILPIDDVVADLKADGALSDVFAGSLERMVWDEHYLALPWALDLRVLFYRTDLLEAAGQQPPTNWDEFKAVAKACSQGGKHGYVVAGTGGGAENLWMWMLGNGGGLFAEDRSLDVFFSRNVEAMQFFADLVAAGVMHPGSAGFSDDDMIRAFGQGSAAFTVYTPGLADSLADIKDKIAITKPLIGPHGDAGTISWINNRMVYAQSKHPDAAKAFMKWLFANELALWTEGNCNQLPIRQTFAKDAYFQKNPILQQVFTDWVPVGKSTGERFKGLFPELDMVEGEGFMTVLLTDLLLGVDAKEALQKAEATLKTFIKD